jgi:hypothetical protein
MHYFAWALVLPRIHIFIGIYMLAFHLTQCLLLGWLFSFIYIPAYTALFVSAWYDPVFSGSPSLCILGWLGAGIIQFFVGHRLIQGTFPKNTALMSPLFRRMGVMYETVFGMALLFRLLLDPQLTSGSMISHNHSLGRPGGQSLVHSQNPPASIAVATH